MKAGSVARGRRSCGTRLGRRTALAFSAVITFLAARTASAQAGVGFPITTMPSPTAPSPMPAPAQPELSALPPQATPTASPPSAANAAGAHELEPGEAASPPSFGQAGQFVVSGQLSANLGFLSYDHSSEASSSASFEPAFEYFFADELLVGGSLLMRYASETSALGFKSSTGTFGATVRFGVNLPLGKVASFEPLAGLGVWQAQTSFEAGEPADATSVDGATVAVGPDVTVTAVFVSLYAPLLVHPASHVFLGIGPEAFRDITHSVDNGVSSANTRRTFIGVSSIVGAWF